MDGSCTFDTVGLIKLYQVFGIRLGFNVHASPIALGRLASLNETVEGHSWFVVWIAVANVASLLLMTATVGSSIHLVSILGTGQLPHSQKRK